MGSEPRRWSLSGPEVARKRVGPIQESPQGPKMWGESWCEEHVFQKQPGKGANEAESGEVLAIHVTPRSNLKLI